MQCENLDVWKRSCRLSVEVYKNFAELKDYGFKDQITRSSLSIASNIAEGLEKDSAKEKVRFIEIARGSTAELITQVYIGIEIGYIEKSMGLKWVKELNDISKMLNGLKKSYKESN
ncbi:four helix bundle protein [Sulfurovum sp. ST-21]|uniref:Four helix bundle protein n=1 Tax=Sulfurovum indicum TaxID=2779528 RepID=A0A7M1S5B1_9BACT|nr:four helix bundle protein [Sulfurovum indicum]QOR62603.1 four helix bundle protein [Sulfurovum indicum]